MRALCFSDVHGKSDIVDFFVKEVKKQGIEFDVVIAAGDINNPQRPRVFTEIMEMLTSLGKPVLYVRGNWDVNLPSLCVPGVIDLEESGPFETNDCLIIGHGRRMKPYNLCSKKPVVLVTHYPPFSIMDRGKKLDAPQQTLHSGLVDINYLVAYYRPVVHIFGHSHTYGGIDWRIGDVLYVNVARLDRVAKGGEYIGNYCLLTIDKGRAKVEWFFLNGSLRRCSGCGKTVHLPPGWTLCRRCANKRDLRFERLPQEFSLVNIEVKVWGNNHLILRETVKVPLNTIANKEAYNDFLEKIILERLVKELEKTHDKVLVLTKDKVIEYYGKRHDGVIVPFSELLFSCDPNLMGHKLCALMRLYSLDKRVHILWGLEGDNSPKIAKEYVLFDEHIILGSEDKINAIRRLGFTPLVIKKKFGT